MLRHCFSRLSLKRWGQFPWKLVSPPVRCVSGVEVPLTAEHYNVKRGNYKQVVMCMSLDGFLYLIWRCFSPLHFFFLFTIVTVVCFRFRNWTLKNFVPFLVVMGSLPTQRM